MVLDPRLIANGLIVPDTFMDVNKMLGLRLSDDGAARGVGHTTHQMRSAPENAYFVWPNSSLEYPRELAATLGRHDLQIRSNYFLTQGNWLRELRAMRGPCLVIDHALNDH